MIDYVLARPAAARDLILALKRREAALPHPVRVLLLERVVDKRFQLVFYPSSSDRGELLAAAHARDALAVSTLSDDELWGLARDFPRLMLGEDVVLPVPREAFFARLGQIDGRRRVLSALVLAEAAAQRGGLDGPIGLEGELRDLLRRDRENLWPREDGSDACAIRDEVEAPVLALATMVDGLRPNHVAALPEEAKRLWEACNTELMNC